jgi:hypothetical protein
MPACRRSFAVSIVLVALIPLLAVAAASRGAPAQPAPPTIVVSDTVLEIRLTDGSILYGRVMAIEGDRVTIATESGGRIEVARAGIARVQRVRGRLVGGERWLDDPNGTRLFFGPTARAVGRGAGYFAVYELVLPYLTIGITDAFSFSAGTPIIPEAMGEVAYLAPKLTVVATEATQIAAGVLAFFGPDEDGSAGLLYGVGTFGSRDNAFTLGAAFPFATSDGFGDTPAIMLGGEARSSQRTKFITENYFVPGESIALLSGGFRFFGERLSADAGIGVFIGEGETACCLPLVNFVYAWGPQGGSSRRDRQEPSPGSLAARALATGSTGETRNHR